MMSELPPVLSSELLSALEDRLTRISAPIVLALRPGLTDDEIDEIVKPLSLRVDGEARTWWRWRTIDSAVHGGGTRDLTGRRWELMTLREAVREARYRVELEAAEEKVAREASLYRAWQDTWLPFSRNSHAALAAVNCTGREDALCPVYYVDPPETEAGSPPEARSLGELVTWWLSAFDEGAYYYNADTGRLAARRGRVPPELEGTGLV
jgi:hypothetical protein